MSAAPVPGPLELCAGMLLGDEDPSATLPGAPPGGPLEALVRAVLPALRRPPCLVSFSGGRDSSAILAVATHAARRHGLPDPVPATLRFPAIAESDEQAWQDLVLSHLRLRERVVVDVAEELDALGPHATAALRAHGVRWPPNAYLHVPLLDRAAGGSLLTGAGGDELLDSRGSRLWLLARRRERPGRRDVLRLARDAAPRRVRAEVWRRREAPPMPWLTPEGLAAAGGAQARDAVRWPGRWDRAVAFWRRTRHFAGLRAAVPLLAAPRDVLALNPFMDDGVLAALAAAGGPAGFPDRTAAMRRIFGGLLPEQVLARRGKAVFSAALWGPDMQAFARDWDGTGVDPALVDAAALQRLWTSGRPPFQTTMLLHAAWLAAQASAASS